MKHLFLIKEYLRYRWRAYSAHGIHSPFMFDFIGSVLEDHRHFYAFDEILQFRKGLLKNNRVLTVEDYGAGSLHAASNHRRIGDIAKTAGRTAHFGQLLFRIVNYYQRTSILELGTSLGIGTAYLSKANELARVITIEGSPAIAEAAQENFKHLGIKNVECLIGNFDEVLPRILKEHSFDLIFIDGNHRKEATLRYFEQIMSVIMDDMILIFDDIHWTPGMQEAWNLIKSDTRVTYSVDLFHFGILFFKKEFKEKQDFILRYA